ncbi:hypothetical protein DPMN_191498 [Dreissena polymorpha]|uniref:Uncharacterized protein n=1 Tax=Dreissena polymorpha TaxID=45954 RepID=A0A9D4BDC2_DREPO|nr:hypothetical protein DPMN_191498 [Dreissena polymorpha]
MKRNITEDKVAQRTLFYKRCMNSAVVDARPFLHYLQYLTYGGLGERDNQLHALRVLESYTCDKANNINLYHLKTALNLLGHCYVMEGYYEMALNCYELSLHHRRINNSANWHVRRVQRLISG